MLDSTPVGKSWVGNVLKFVLCLWLISMVTVCYPPLSPDLVSQSPPVPNADPTYVVSCCMFGSFRYFQTPLQICLLSHVTSPCIPPFSSLRVCVNLATLLYIQAVGSNWTSLSCSFLTAVFNKIKLRQILVEELGFCAIYSAGSIFVYHNGTDLVL